LVLSVSLSPKAYATLIEPIGMAAEALKGELGTRLRTVAIEWNTDMSMPPKTERFEMRLDTSMLERVDAWRRKQEDSPSRGEAIRQLISAWRDTPNGEADALFEMMDDLQEAAEIMKSVAAMVQTAHLRLLIAVHACSAEIGGAVWAEVEGNTTEEVVCTVSGQTVQS
jgi:Ribbon-helix-helix protein, copG family